MNQQEVEQWIAANGGPALVQYSRSSRRIQNPARLMTLPDGSANPQYNPMDERDYIDITEEGWTAYDKDGKPTGAVLQVRRRDDNTFDVVKNEGAKPGAAASDAPPPGGKPYQDDGPEAGASGRRWGWNPDTEAYDRDLGPSPSAQKPATESVRLPVPGKPGVFQVTTKNAQTQQTETHYEDASGNTIPTPADAPTVSTRTEVRGGKSYTVVTSTPKDGSAPTITVLGPDGQAVPGGLPDEGPKREPITRNGKTYIQVRGADGSLHFEDQQGNTVELPPEEKPGAYQPLPPGVPPFVPDLTRLDLGLGDRRRQLDALVNDGTITKEQAAATIAADSENAVTAGRNAGSVVNIQSGNRDAALTARAQDASDAASRRTYASSTFNQALSGFDSTTGKILAGGGEAATAGFLARLGLAQHYLTQLGGNNPLPAYNLSDYPVLNTLGQANIPGVPGGAPLGNQWVWGPNGPVQVPAGTPGATSTPTPNPATTELATPSELQAQREQQAAAEAARQQTIAAPPAFADPTTGGFAVPGSTAPGQPQGITINIGGGGATAQQQPTAPPSPLFSGPAANLFARMGGQSAGAAYDPIADGLHEDLANAGFEPDAIAQAFAPKPIGGGLG